MGQVKRRMQWWCLPVMMSLLAGCATAPPVDREQLEGASQLLYSIRNDSDLKLAVSPAGRTLRVAGATGLLVGGGVDAVVNERYRRQLDEVMGDWAPGTLFYEHLELRLMEALPPTAQPTAPLGSTVGYQTHRDAAQDRYAQLARAGADRLLDIQLAQGIYGPNGMLLAEIEADLRELPSGRRAGYAAITGYPDVLLASEHPGNPARRIAPNIRNPRLRAGDGAITQWLEDGGRPLREGFSDVVEGTVAALLQAFGLAEDARGAYYLGKSAFINREFEQAVTWFRKALLLDPGMAEAQNGLTAALWHGDQRAEAAETARNLTATHPNFGPGWLNLAWILHELGAAQLEVREAYTRATTLGMPPDETLDTTLAP